MTLTRNSRSGITPSIMSIRSTLFLVGTALFSMLPACTNGDAPGGGATEGGTSSAGVSGNLGLGAGGAHGGAPTSGFSGSTSMTAGTSSGGTPAGGMSSSAGASAGGNAPSGGGGSSENSGGAGGMSVAGGGSSGGSGALGGFGGAPVDKPGTVEIGVRNGCGFSLWIHGAGDSGVLAPDDQEIKPGAIGWYDAPQNWSAARVTAYTDGPRATELDKVEMTLVNNNDAAAEILNYNVTYVDWLGLPVEIVSRGGGPDCKPVGCYIPQGNVLQGCPNGLLDGRKCQSARSYCLNPVNQSAAYCNALNAEIQSCAQNQPGCSGAAGATTAEAYACSGTFFSGSPKWCAALNRHTQASPDSTDKSTYYTSAPYNTYSKWVHDVCPGIYAFAYDDYPSTSDESGFHSCSQGKELDITFCPKG